LAAHARFPSVAIPSRHSRLVHVVPRPSSIAQGVACVRRRFPSFPVPVSGGVSVFGRSRRSRRHVDATRTAAMPQEKSDHEQDREGLVAGVAARPLWLWGGRTALLTPVWAGDSTSFTPQLTGVRGGSGGGVNKAVKALHRPPLKKDGQQHDGKSHGSGQRGRPELVDMTVPRCRMTRHA
jgi:hypothetical protein